MTDSRELAHPVTLDELLHRCMGELQFAQNILQSFVDSCPGQLEDIRSDIDAGNLESLPQKSFAMSDCISRR